MRALAVASIAAALVLGVVAATVAGCKDPAPPNGAVTCAPGGLCPTGYSCVFGNTCYRNGASLDLGVAATDAATTAPDLALVRSDGGDPCDDYCECMETACKKPDLGFDSEPSCYAACRTFTAGQRTCRIDHCKYARDGLPPDGPNPTKHCPHAMGVQLCVD